MLNVFILFPLVKKQEIKIKENNQITIYAIGLTPSQNMLIINGSINAYSRRLKGTAHVVK